MKDLSEANRITQEAELQTKRENILPLYPLPREGDIYEVSYKYVEPTGENALESGWISKQLFEQVCEERDKLAELIDNLYKTLSGLLADITEYQDINNLGGENNHWQIKAREILTKVRNEL